MQTTLNIAFDVEEFDNDEEVFLLFEVEIQSKMNPNKQEILEEMVKAIPKWFEAFKILAHSPQTKINGLWTSDGLLYSEGSSRFSNTLEPLTLEYIQTTLMTAVREGFDPEVKSGPEWVYSLKTHSYKFRAELFR